MDAYTLAIYDELRRVAKDGGITRYSDVAPLANLDMDSPEDRNRIADILDEISRCEYADGKPLLSAVVIRKDTNIPGRGFFELAKSLRLPGVDDDVLFWVKEVQRVHDYWRQVSEL